MTAEFELLGQFYLGRVRDPAGGAPTDELLLYDSKDLTTHAVIVGMTGSGKTGLGIGLIEEAAIDGIPTIVIDPKGDLGNLLLAFPALRPEDFKPWIDPAHAAQAGQTIDVAAAEAAALWTQGLGKWREDGQRIAKYQAAADAAIYTPGSNAGLPLSVLRSFGAPPAAVLDDPEALRDRVTATASGVLALVGIDGDPLGSREHMLVSNILDRAWRAGKSLDLGGLVQAVQSPPFERIGVLDLEAAFPAKERFGLAMSLNGLLASPNFSAWTEGEPLDVQRLLWTAEGKPRISIMSIAHLGDAERMFFVTTLLNEVVAWMRAQPGTPSLRALLYMDEVFGFFPPTANPPSKKPMLTLLKQARAFGVGVVLATQNPVDLDYKGLGNAGTWFLGRLQTERDKLRVLDGLEGVSAAASQAFDRSRLDKMLSGLGKRVFLMSNAHESAPVLFETRWTLSYLGGPLTRSQIQRLMAARKAGAAPAATSPQPAAGAAARAAATSEQRPPAPPGVSEAFLPVRTSLAGARIEYRPAILASAKIHYSDKKAGVDLWETASFLAPPPDDLSLEPWSASTAIVGKAVETAAAPESPAGFAALSGAIGRAKSYEKWSKALKDHVLQTRSTSIWSCPDLKAISAPGETEGAFRARASLAARERRDARIEAARDEYAGKLQTLEDRIRTAEGRVGREQEQVSQSRWQTASSFGSAVLGALFGRRVVGGSSLDKASRGMRGLGRTSRQKEDVARAEEGLSVLRQRRSDLLAKIESEVALIRDEADPAKLACTEVKIAPKRTGVTVGSVVLAWAPWRVLPDGSAEAAYVL
jgi:Helicase HerA, central domain